MVGDPGGEHRVLREDEIGRLARALSTAKEDTRFAVLTFLQAVENGHPAKLELVADRKGAVEGELTTGPDVSR